VDGGERGRTGAAAAAMTMTIIAVAIKKIFSQSQNK
jgi:hypothetical protein